MYGFGKIQEFGDEKDDNDDAYTCRVVPENSDGVLTMPLYIPLNLRKIMQNAQVGETVFYALNEQCGGVVIALIPPYVDGTYQDWDFIIRNTLPLQINGDLHIKGSITVDTDSMVKGNQLVQGNVDVEGDLSADGDIALSKGLEITGSNTKIGGTVKIDGVTATGAKPFNGFPGGSDTFTGAPVSQDTVNASPLSGDKASGNEGNYEMAEDNEERESENGNE